MTTKNGVLIKGGTIVDPEGAVFAGDILCRDGVIYAVENDLTDDTAHVYDATGAYIFPGFIDTHVHLGYSGPVVDDLPTETAAAIAGGVTTVCHFAKALKHRETQVSFHEIVDEIAADVERLSHADVALHLHLATYEQVSEMESYARRGFPSYKIYMSYRDDPKALARGTVGVTDDILFAALAESAKLPGTVVMVHCENWDLVEYLSRSRDGDPDAFTVFSASHAGIAEADDIRRAAFYASQLNAQLYVVHVSSREGLEAAREARSYSESPVYLETCPHYLLLTDAVAETLPGAMAKTTPPVHGAENLEALWDAIKRGDFDTIGSDHAACDISEKTRVSDGAAGFPSIEVGMRLFLAEGVRRGVDLCQLARLSSLNAAKIFGMWPRKGSVRVGADADLVVMEFGEAGFLDASTLHSRAGYSPYAGFPLKSTVRATFLRGSLKSSRGQIVGAPSGRLVLRETVQPK